MSSKKYCDHCKKEVEGEPETVLLGGLFDDDERPGMGWKDVCTKCFSDLKKWFGIK